MKDPIAILGAGSWGTALAIHLAHKGFHIKLWTRKFDHYQHLLKNRENTQYLPGVELQSNICITNDIYEAVLDTSPVILAIPSHAVRSTLQNCKDCLSNNTIIVNTAKGFDEVSLLRISDVVYQETGNNNFVALSGPSHAEEVSRFLPTAIVAASQNRFAAEYIQDIFMSPNLRVYTNPDVCGVEVGGALKNIIALATGISDGLGYGDNTRAALMTRGLTEITRLGIAMNAEPLTFAGLTGIGDLIVTCSSMHSRNRRAGILLGQGLKLEEVLKNIGMVVEGIRTTKSAVHLAKKLGVDMPMTQEIYHVLFENKEPTQSVNDLMGRQKTHEVEEVVRNTLNW